MKNTPQSEWLLEGLGAAVLIVCSCGVVALGAQIVAIWETL